MKYDLTRVVYLIGLVLGFLAVTVGLNVVQAATYEGQWTKIILDRVNPSSLDLKGTVKVTGPDLTPKNYNLPATITAGRLASLAKGFLRGGVYGVAVDAAMQSAGWVWDEILRNWRKTFSCEGYPPWPGGCAAGYYSNGVSGVGCIVYDYKVGPPAWGSCTGLSGYSAVNGGCGSFSCVYQEQTYQTSGTLYRKVLSSGPVVQSASDQDIFDDGVKPNAPNVIPDLITGLPQVIGTPTEQLKPPSLPSIHWPEIVLDIINFINNLNFTQNLFDIVNQSFTDINSLTQTQIDTLVNSGIDIQTLINAINNTINNTTLTTDEKNQLNLWNNLQTSTTTPPVVVPPEPVAIEIPTDCDLIPFVCAWLEWYRGWLTDEPPPVPEVVIPIEELDDFDPGNGPSGSCPAPYQFSVFSRSYEVSYQPFCDLALLLNPLIIAMAWLISGYIVTRSR